MDRQDFERVARSLAEQASATFPSTTHASQWLLDQGIKPDVLPQTTRFRENVAFFGASEWPTFTKKQRQDICDEFGWSEPDEIAWLAVAEITSRQYGSDVVAHQRTVAILQKMDQDVEIYWMDGQGQGWTTSPVIDTLASF